VTCDSQGEAGSEYVQGVNCRVTAIDGHPRKYIVYVPRGPRHDPDRKRPLVLMYHGTGGDGEQFLNISGWREQAERHDLIAVFPTGLRYDVLDGGLNKKTKWHSFGLSEKVDLADRPRGYPDDSPWPADDVAFTNAILDDAEDGLEINRKRIYASGFSNGAEFTARLAVELSDRLAAVGYAAGGLNDAHQPVRPIPVAAIVGTLDDRVQQQLGMLGSELPLEPEPLLGLLGERFVEPHLETLGLAALPFVLRRKPASTTFRWLTTAPGSDPGSSFTLSVLAGLEHKYPNGRNNPEGFVAARHFLEFFSRHRLP
jgi:polyhydroxybutyrate depolymerase